MKFIVRKAAPASIALIIALSAVLVTMPVEPAWAGSCPAPSTSLTFNDGQMDRFDLDSPVRPTPTNPDKNLTYRELVNGTFSDSLFGHGLTWTGLQPYTTSDTTPPPQVATVFSPARTPAFTKNYQVHNWHFADSPTPGNRGTLIVYNYPSVQSRAIGMTTTPGEPLRAPCHGYNLGSPWGVGGYGILYADSTSITLVATRNDSVARGYVLHILGVNVNPTLLSNYNGDDSPSSGRYHNAHFNLPGLKAGQVFGTAAGTEIIVALRDNGTFMDTGDSTNWWRIRTWPASPFTAPGPVLTSPGNGFVIKDATPDYQWQALAGVTGYKIEVATASTFGASIVDTQTFGAGTTTYTPVTGLNNQVKYYWHVAGEFSAAPTERFSSTFSFTVNLAPGKPTPLTPTGLTNNASPTFTWTGKTDASRYTLVVSGPESHTQTNILPASAGCDVGTNCSLAYPFGSALVANGAYTFTVEAISDTFGTRGPSAGLGFTLDTHAPAIPTNVSPGGTAIATPSVTLKANAVSTATKYNFELRLSKPTGLTGTSNGSNTTPSKVYALGTNFGNYIWAVNAADAAGNTSGWSTPFQFNYTLTSAPANGAKFAKTAKITLSWKSYATGATYKVAYSSAGDTDPTNDCGNTDHCAARGTARTYVLPTLTPGVYTWSLQVNGGGNWMMPWKFTVLP